MLNHNLYIGCMRIVTCASAHNKEMNNMDITNDLIPLVDGLHHTQKAMDVMMDMWDPNDEITLIIRDMRNTRGKMITLLGNKM